MVVLWLKVNNNKYIIDDVFIYEISYIDKNGLKIITEESSISKTAVSNTINAKYRKSLDHILEITRKSKQGELLSINPMYKEFIFQ